MGYGAVSVRGGHLSWHVYLVRCCNGALYTGITTDVARRVAQHNAGKGARYTRANGPVKLVYTEPAADHAAALRRERALKQLTRARKLELIAAQQACTDLEATS